MDASESPVARIERIERELALPAASTERPTRNVDEGVSITSFSPVPELFEAEETAGEEHSRQPHASSEPPMPPSVARTSVARTAIVQPRMPRVDDFPAIAQDEMRRKAAALAEEGDKGALGLLRKLAQVGLSRRDEEPSGGQGGERAATAARPVPMRNPVQGQAPVQQASHDGLGRAQQPSRPIDEEAMDIPAFLRRKSL